MRGDTVIREEILLEPSFVNLTELALKRPDVVRDVVRDEAARPRTILNFLLIGLSGIALFSAALTIIVACAPPIDFLPRVSLTDQTVLKPLLTYALGVAGAIGICLPSFYFFGLLAGVRASMTQVTAISLHAFAKSGIILLGLVPIYVAAVLGVIILGATDGPIYPTLVSIGIALPFVAGTVSLRVTYEGFVDLLRTLPEGRAARRAPMVRLLALAWAGLYTAVAPVTLWAVRTQLERAL